METLPAAVTPPPHPWRTMWFSPRITIRGILDVADRPSWMPVAVLAVASTAIAQIKADDSGVLSLSRSMMPVILSSLNLVYGLIIAPFVAAIVGGWLGGDADPTDLREAIAWSYVPIAASSVLWIPILLTLGTRAFGAGAEPFVGLEWLGALLLIAISVSYFWTIPLQVGGLAAAQRFSIGKAILYVLILSIPLFLLAALT
jgi:hypothetical protein